MTESAWTLRSLLFGATDGGQGCMILSALKDDGEDIEVTIALTTEEMGKMRQGLSELMTRCGYGQN